MSKEAAVEECRNLRLFICTWNVGGTDPLNENEIEKLLRSDEKVDIYAIGFQEIKTGARETVSSFIRYDDWAKALMDYMSKKQYYMVESVRVQGISLSVFSSINHLPSIRFVRTEIERTGVAGAWGNKGGVAISCCIYNQTVLFLNMHLSAHLQNVEDRIGDIDEILKEMDFGGHSSVQSHDLVLMFGDTNFRIDDLDREAIIKHVEAKNYSPLWEKDQLKKHKKTHSFLLDFEEGTLDFDPTYKYDPGTDKYDSSEKQRKPAWTDRILWRIHPEGHQQNTGPLLAVKLVDKSFTNHMNFKQSDHKPVTCQLDFKIFGDSAQDPLVHIEKKGEWVRDRDGKFTVELCEGMKWSSKDYVGLYKECLKDFRSYESYMYPHDLKPDSSSSSSSDEEQSIQKSTRAVARKLNDRAKTLVFKKSQITEKGLFRLGYYSHKMQTLISVTHPFQID